MLYINKLTDDASQRLILTGIPTLQISMTLKFMPRIGQWILGVSYGDVSIQGIPVVTSLNLLRQQRNNIPFGIACLTANNVDPFEQTAFSSQSANLYLLNEDDVAQVEKDWFE